MRQLKLSEIEKRGCRYCDARTSEKKYSYCPHEECPYHELDKVKSYGEYIQKTNKSGLARALRELAKE